MKTLFSSVIILFFISCFWSCKDKLEVQQVSGENIEIDDSITDDSEINAFIEPYKTSIEDEMNKILSYTPKAMYKNDTPYNTAIGNMMADAVFEVANPVFYQRFNDSIDAVLLNYGGIRAGINKGKITTRTAYNIMPFENMVVVAKLDHKGVEQMVEYLSKAKKAHPISNMSIKLNGNWKLLDFRIADNAIVKGQFYYIATSDYLVNGGDNMTFFQEAEAIYPTDYKLRSLLIDYFEANDTIRSMPDRRFQMIKQ